MRAGKTNMVLGAVVLAIALIAGGFASGFGRADAATASVTISDFAFTPATTSINVGDTVTCTNVTSSTTHTVTSDTGVWDSGNVAPGAAFSRTFTAAGTFPYHCAIHPAMTGTVVVATATATATATTTTTGTATATGTATTSPTATATATTPATATSTTVPPTPTRTATLAATAATSATPGAPATGAGSDNGGSKLPIYFALGVAAAGIATAAAGGAIALRRRS